MKHLIFKYSIGRIINCASLFPAGTHQIYNDMVKFRRRLQFSESGREYIYVYGGMARSICYNRINIIRGRCVLF